MWHKPESFFDLNALEGPAAKLFDGMEFVWEALDKLEGFIKATIKPNVSALRKNGDLILKPCALVNGEAIEGVSYELGDPCKDKLKVYHQGELLKDAALVMAGAVIVSDDVEIGAGALVESGALIKGPTIIGPRSDVRQTAYVRGAVMSSPGAVIGHSTEAKNTLLLDGAKAGHFAYLGDSILGREVNLGAGSKLANLKMLNRPCRFKVGEECFEVDRRKFGAIIGDETETGCNSVTNPGCLMGRRVRVLPNTSVPAGYHPDKTYIGLRR